MPMCRTIIFDGSNVAINQNEQCSSFMNPICEKEKSFCKTSNSSHTLNHDWVRVGGQGLYYKLSRTEYTYCHAKYQCQNKMRGQLFAGGNYTYMGLLGKELGITGRMKVEFWLNSPGVSCPSGKEEGSVMQYSGPYVHIAANKSAQFQFMMFCMSDKPGTTTQTQSSIQQTYTSPRSTTQQTYTSPSSTTQQTYTSPRSTAQQTYTSSSSTTQQTYTSSSSTTQQTYTLSSSTTKPTYTSSSSTTKQTYTSSSSTTKPTYTSSSSTTKPLINFKAKVNTLALSKTSGEPAWLKVGKKKYFINYNCSVYKQTSSFVNYFRIFSNPVSKANSFWIGANIITDNELDETDVHLKPYKYEPVQFKMTKEHVQSMWKHLRQQRKSSPVRDGNAGG
ncbi:uncharacterized protein LOC132726890 [Ruditapes philippinarum]|uniref:uncharacterized protein LOC132726890 n=1 Tax=Ruditapes philippinarum TaxID=129788 RepID=UPI00295C1820|nr:uncharacterized protein LOC132726890 [Ruditapes philippinarum]